MELTFRRPAEETKQVMCDASLEMGNRSQAREYQESAMEIIKKVTGHDQARILSSGNAAIMAAMADIKGPVMIPDQGGWSGFRKMAEFLGKPVLYLPTLEGVVDEEILKEQLGQKKPAALFITSFAGYTAEQPVKAIFEICDDHSVLLVEDASGSVGDPAGNLANGDHSHVIVASTGSPKVVNIGNGGFISTNDPQKFQDTSFLLKTVQASMVTCAGLREEIKKAPLNLVKTIDACKFLKKELKTSLHPDKRGVNVTIPVDEPKKIGRTLRQALKVKGGGMITTCPRYDRIKKPAICLEIKNLDINCMTPENLQKIVDTVHSETEQKG
ncbi:MAG: hypothetical protein PWQ15_1351 [Methanobacterium sp.]|jgi:hypothetical protein|uniref:DegT/DnrJ/EryC1/StrS family aminotransferase n=1 Tax=Methanobacterium sp. TaxID=2164 RepID=UPI0003C98FC6|nr:DegT/DnrJ/EryC1/StrS family aminotransferase [Methanobacterium sp.]MDI3550248.1 hypothetical protein [Methanobacterium sp.]CDG64449.1 hypothetical protein MBMB1_0339 [Methanobacterium sp. MB1]